MPIPANLDFDRLAYHALRDTRAAVSGWAEGAPRDETALMNRLTQKLVRRRRGCDVGLERRINLEPSIYSLHRQGKRQVDKFGSDFAVTVQINYPYFCKTAFIQLKRAVNHTVMLEKDQLSATRARPKVFSRSFAMAVDEVRQSIRIQESQKLWGRFPNNQVSQRVTIRGWVSFTEWLKEWISCDLGAESDADEDDPVEGLLEEFVLEGPTDLGRYSDWYANEHSDVSDDYLPARAWMQLIFKADESDVT